MDPIFLAVVKKGKLIFEDLNLFKNHVISFEEKCVDVIVRKHKRNRTNQQNRWYWSCVVGIPAKHYGYLPEEMHDAFKMLFLRCHDAEKPETVRSTTSLSTVEFNEYVEKCRQWCAENGFVIPDPQKVFLGDAVQ